jgi:hypothetical protein
MGGEICFLSLTQRETCPVALLSAFSSRLTLLLIFLKGSLRSNGLEITLMLGERV